MHCTHIGQSAVEDFEGQVRIFKVLPKTSRKCSTHSMKTTSGSTIAACFYLKKAPTVSIHSQQDSTSYVGKSIVNDFHCDNLSPSSIPSEASPGNRLLDLVCFCTTNSMSAR